MERVIRQAGYRLRAGREQERRVRSRRRPPEGAQEGGIRAPRLGAGDLLLEDRGTSA